jgi:predicted  nucleic acid-binding Zn-ribbon protein
MNIMAKETIAKENPVTDALRKLKEEEAELVVKLKPLQEAISALEKILDKSVKKVKTSSSAKENTGDNLFSEEPALESSEAE